MRALIIGSGPDVYDDVDAAKQLGAYDVTLGVNDAAYDFQPVDWHVTLHPENFNKRRVAPLVGHVALAGVDRAFTSRPKGAHNSGSSGLFAVRFALEDLKATRIVLAGVPLDVSPHYFGGGDWANARNFRLAWNFMFTRGELNDVRSMSGWTAKLLGRPTPQWLQTDPQA